MSRGGSYGGGKSSLGYLFGSDQQPQSSEAPPASPRPHLTITKPPWGDDNNINNDQKLMKIHSPSQNQNVSNNNYRRDQGQNSGNFITERPSTKVQSVPGGDSSLGYLFGDK